MLALLGNDKRLRMKTLNKKEKAIARPAQSVWR